jgi:hypothetical protein
VNTKHKIKRETFQNKKGEEITYTITVIRMTVDFPTAAMEIRRQYNNIS